MKLITITAGWLPPTLIEIVKSAVPTLVIETWGTVNDSVWIKADRNLTPSEIAAVRAAIAAATPQISSQDLQ